MAKTSVPHWISLTRLAVSITLSALRVDAAQTAAPWAVSDSQTIIRTSGQSPAASYSPTGQVYIAGRLDEYPFPTPSLKLGDTSGLSVNYVTKLDGAGRAIYTVALGGTYIIGLNFDAASDVYVSGTALVSGFYTTQGAFRSATAGDHEFFLQAARTRRQP